MIYIVTLLDKTSKFVQIIFPINLENDPTFLIYKSQFKLFGRPPLTFQQDQLCISLQQSLVG